MIKGVTHAHLGPIWYHSETSERPLFPKPVSWLGLFFAASYSKTVLGWILLIFSLNQHMTKKQIPNFFVLIFVAI